MRYMKRFVLALAALSVALAAAPAAADERIVEYFFYSTPPSLTQYQYCYTESGHWTWDGVQYVWMPSQTVCRTEYR